jgi:hypothetical protein
VCHLAFDWLHLALAVGMIALGVLLCRANSGARAPRNRPAPAV